VLLAGTRAVQKRGAVFWLPVAESGRHSRPGTPNLVGMPQGKLPRPPAAASQIFMAGPRAVGQCITVTTNTTTIAALSKDRMASGTSSLRSFIATPRFQCLTGRRSRPLWFDGGKKKIRYSAMCGALATAKNPFFDHETSFGYVRWPPRWWVVGSACDVCVLVSAPRGRVSEARILCYRSGCTIGSAPDGDRLGRFGGSRRTRSSERNRGSPLAPEPASDKNES
jgi:hypothetical protein